MPVRGPQLRVLFAAKEFGDGVHFAYQLRADGTFTGTEMARDVTGRWRTTEREFCWRWTKPRGAEECYDVEQSGGEVRLLRNRSEDWYGTLKPLR